MLEVLRCLATKPIADKDVVIDLVDGRELDDASENAGAVAIGE
jgi:hypothetical protein